MAMFDIKNPHDMIRNVMLVVVGILVLVALVPTLISALTNLSDVGDLEFASFFAAGGAIQIALGAAILLMIFGLFLGRSKR